MNNKEYRIIELTNGLFRVECKGWFGIWFKCSHMGDPAEFKSLDYALACIEASTKAKGTPVRQVWP